MPAWTSKLLLFMSWIIAAPLFAAVAALAVSYGSLNNIAATEATLARRLASALDHGAIARACSRDAPAALTEQQVLTGGGDFGAMCATCHGAPGQERGEIGKGLNPQPPSLSNAADRWSRAELFHAFQEIPIFK